MKKTSSRILSFLLTLSVALSVGMMLPEPTHAATEATATVDTFENSENLLSGLADYGWDKPADGTNESSFIQGKVTMDGEAVYTLTRPEETKYNKSAFITYSVDQMSSFRVSFLMGMSFNKIPGNAVFEVAKADRKFTKLTSVIRAGEDPTKDYKNDSTAFKRWTYTGLNIPKDVKYLKINLPMPVANNRIQSVQLEKVKISQNAVLGQWNATTKADMNYPTNTSADLSWPALDAVGDFRYQISQENIAVAAVDKKTTEFHQENLTEHTQYRFGVYVIQENDDHTADFASQLIHTDILKTGGNPDVFVDQFKFQETISDYGVWSSDQIEWDADTLAVQRKNATDRLEIVYQMDRDIVDFEVAMRVGFTYSLPGETTFQVSNDGANWVPVAAERPEADPKPWVYTIYHYSPVGSIPAGMKYLKIIYGVAGGTSANKPRAFSVQLKEVNMALTNLTPEEAAKAAEIRAALAWEKLSDQKPDSVTKDLNLPSKVTVGGEDFDVGWVTTNESAVTSGGVITRVDIEQKATIKATVQLGVDKTVDLSYDLVVLREGIDGIFTDPCDNFNLIAKDQYSKGDLEIKDMTEYNSGKAIGYKNGSKMDGSQFIVYELENMNRFEIEVIDNKQGNAQPLVFEAGDSEGNFAPFRNFTQGPKISISGVTDTTWGKRLYTSQELPPGTKYLKVYLGAVSPANKHWAYGITEARIMQLVERDDYVWPAGAQLTVSEVLTDQAVLTWPAVEPLAGKTTSYEVYCNGVLTQRTTDTSVRLTGLERNSRHNIYVRAKAQEDDTLASRRLLGDDFRTERKRGILSPILGTGDQVRLEMLTPGDVASATAKVTISDASVFDNRGYLTFGFYQADGTLGNAYVKVYSTWSEYYKNGVLVMMLDHRRPEAGKAFEISTDDCWITEEGQTLAVSGNANMTDISLHITKNDEELYFANMQERVVNNETVVSLLDSGAPLENLSRGFTFETDILLLAGTGASNFSVKLISDTDYTSADKAMIASLDEGRSYSPGVVGNLIAQYTKTDSGNPNAWLPRLEFDGQWRKLQLFVDFGSKTIDMAIDHKILAEDFSFNNIGAADLSKLVFGGNFEYSLRNTQVRGGYQGFAWNAVGAVDSEGKKLSLLKAEQPANMRYSVINSEAVKTIQLLRQQGHDASVLQEIELAAREGFQYIDVPVMPTAPKENIKLMAWESVASMQPVMEPSAYIGTPTARQTDRRLFLIGDSTVHFVSNPNVGWGEKIQEYLKDTMTVYNYAKDGINTRTYLNSKRMNAMSPYMREGDFLMIQLGHNDNANGIPMQEYEDNLRTMIAFARQRGLNVILVTPVTLRVNVGNSEEELKTKSRLYGNVTALEKIAAEQQIPIIDLFRTSVNNLQDKGVSASNNSDIYTDGTHFTEKGARVLVSYIKELLKEQDLELYSYFNDNNNFD